MARTIVRSGNQETARVVSKSGPAAAPTAGQSHGDRANSLVMNAPGRPCQGPHVRVSNLRRPTQHTSRCVGGNGPKGGGGGHDMVNLAGGMVSCAAPGRPERSQPCLRGPRCGSPWQPPHPPGSDRRRGGPAAWKVSHCVRKAPTLTPGQPPDAALWQPDQVTPCPPEPDVIGLAVGTLHVAWARVGYGGTPGSTCSGTLRPPPCRRGGRNRAIAVDGVSPYRENWAKRAGARRTDIVPRR
jgi:hypothetical protein